MLVKQYQVVVRDCASQKETRTVSFQDRDRAEVFMGWVERHVLPSSTLIATVRERVVRQ